MSEGYNKTHGYSEIAIKSHKARTTANSAAYLLPSILPHMRILDVGCGPGSITIGLAALVPQGHVVGLDISEEVLVQARALAASHPEVTNIEFQIGNVVEELPFPDDTFDLVHSHQVLQHLRDPVKAIREMRRVTKRGGLVAARVADFSTVAWYPENKGIERWRDIWVDVSRSLGFEPDAGRKLHVWAKEAGFERGDIKTSSSVMFCGTPEEVEWWGGLWKERVLAEPFVGTAVEGGFVERVAELEEISKGWESWAECEDGWMANVQGEIVCRK